MAKRKKIIIEEKTIKTSKLKASEWAMQDGSKPLDFVWWDENEGVISEERYLEIKKIVGR